MSAVPGHCAIAAGRERAAPACGAGPRPPLCAPPPPRPEPRPAPSVTRGRRRLPPAPPLSPGLEGAGADGRASAPPRGAAPGAVGAFAPIRTSARGTSVRRRVGRGRCRRWRIRGTLGTRARRRSNRTHLAAKPLRGRWCRVGRRGRPHAIAGPPGRRRFGASVTRSRIHRPPAGRRRRRARGEDRRHASRGCHGLSPREDITGGGRPRGTVASTRAGRGRRTANRRRHHRSARSRSSARRTRRAPGRADRRSPGSRIPNGPRWPNRWRGTIDQRLAQTPTGPTRTPAKKSTTGRASQPSGDHADVVGGDGPAHPAGAPPPLRHPVPAARRMTAPAAVVMHRPAPAHAVDPRPAVAGVAPRAVRVRAPFGADTREPHRAVQRQRRPLSIDREVRRPRLARPAAAVARGG